MEQLQTAGSLGSNEGMQGENFYNVFMEARQNIWQVKVEQ